MNEKKYRLFFLMFLLPLIVQGQSTNYIFNGYLHIKNGKTFPYQLVFTLSGNLIKGYSATTLTDGTEPKTSITGSLNMKQQTFTFSESTFYPAQKTRISCFVNATLNCKPNNKGFSIRGDFKGKDIDGLFCGEGSIEFEQVNLPGLLADHRMPKQAATKDILPLKDTMAAPEQEGEYEITAGVSKKFDWRTDSCIVEIYDGGIVDGDMVTLELNDKEVLSRYSLVKAKKRIRLPLNEKVSTLAIIAENEGKIPTNTANIILTDGYRHYRIKAYNNIGERALVILNRK